MNRKEEYDLLMQELEEVPARLNYTVARARTKARRRNMRRWVWAPVSTLSAVCVAFVLLVNLSMPFAMACARVPLLRDLAKAVSFSPSLSAAVENRWVQIIDQTDTDGDYTMTVEYVIVDQKQLNVFYSVEGIDPETHYMPRVDVQAEDGSEQQGYTITAGSVRDDGELHSFHVEFSGEYEMPSGLLANVELVEFDPHSDQEEIVGKFDFALRFDPDFTDAGRVVDVNEWIEMDGQRICLTTMEIYPTHARVNFESDPANTHWLRSLDLYARDENGVRYEIGSASGIVGARDPVTAELKSVSMNGNYFSAGEHLTICMTGAEWLEKENQWTWVDLSAGESGPMPEGTVWTGYEWEGETLHLDFLVAEKGDGSVSFPVSIWRNPGKTEQGCSSFGSGKAKEPGYHNCYVFLDGVTGDRVELKLNYTDQTEFDTPIAIKIS